MYRVRLSILSQEEIGYQIRDMTPELFSAVATGQQVEGDIEAQSRWPGDSMVYYTGVWDAELDHWVQDLTAEQAELKYAAWSKETWA